MSRGHWGGLVLHQRKGASSAPPPSGGSPPPASAALTGTATGSWYESDVVAGGKTIIITLTNDTWVAAGGTFDAQRQNIIDGIDSAQSEAAGWDVKRALLAVTDVVRTSATVVTITLDALASYVITATETLTVTVPGTAVSGGSSIVATPTLTIAEGSPSSLYPNKPGTYTTTTTLDFSQAVPGSIGAGRPIAGSSWSLSYDVDDGGGVSSASHISDGTAPVDTDVWQMHFAPGTFGTSHGVGIIYYDPPSAPQHMYVSLHGKFSASYPWHAISNKFLWFSASNGDPYFVQSYGNGRWLHAQNNGSNQYLDNVNGLLQGATLNTYKNDAITDGVYHQFESVLDLAAGTWKIWLDGDLKLDATGVIALGGKTIGEFVLEAYRGGGGETLATDCYNYWDNLHLAW